MQDNRFTSFPSDRQEHHYREPVRRFGLGSLFATGFLCFVLGALACVVTLMATGLIPVGAKPAFEGAATPKPTFGNVITEEPVITPAPSATPAQVPEETPDPGPTSPAAPTAPREELPVPVLGSAEPPVIDRDRLIASIFEQTSPSVCGVSGRTYVYSEVTKRNNEEETSAGTGIVLTADGYIVTNNHIIAGVDKVYVTCEGVEYEAEIVGTDATMDLAVLKAIDATNLKPSALGDSSALRIGDTAVAIGDPLGTLKLTCTNGIISGLDREINTDGRVQNYIQTNAAVNPGNSGGPLINERGEVIGIVTMKTIVAGYDDYGNAISAEGLGYAIPINDALPVVSQLIQYGYIPHPAIGIQGYEVTQFLSEELQVPQGVYVSTVYANGPAGVAGIMVDDVIVGVEGKSITTFAELSGAIKSRRVGDPLKLTIWRAGEVMEVELIIGDMNNIDASPQPAQPGDGFFQPQE